MKSLLVTSLMVILTAAAADAALVLDQQQTTIDLGTLGTGFLVGGDQHYELAQTVTAGIDGQLARIEIPVVCESGRLEVEIRDLVPGEVPGTLVPGTTILSRGGGASAEFPPSDGFVFRPIALAPTVAMSAGDQYAIVLHNHGGRCGVGMGLSVDLYAGGASFWRYAGTPTDVWLTTGGFADPIDIAFRTFVETGAGLRAGFTECLVAGFRAPVPIPDFVPLCRCVADASLRETRCGFYHPSMFLVRTLPAPLPAGKPFTVRWTLFALKPLDGAVQVDDVFPPGFQDASKSLVFSGGPIPAGSAATLSYQAVAGPKKGAFRILSSVRLEAGQEPAEEGTLRTTVEIAPP